MAGWYLMCRPFRCRMALCCNSPRPSSIYLLRRRRFMGVSCGWIIYNTRTTTSGPGIVVHFTRIIYCQKHHRSPWLVVLCCIRGNNSRVLLFNCNAAATVVTVTRLSPGSMPLPAKHAKPRHPLHRIQNGGAVPIEDFIAADVVCLIN